MDANARDNPFGPLTDAALAEDAARFLKALANDKRLMLLCTLQQGELSVSELMDRVPLSQSALSQHLAVLRRAGMVTTRRQSQIIYYRLADRRIQRLMPMICDIFGKGA